MSLHTMELAADVGAQLDQFGWKLGTAESCTGGMLAAAITDIPGSSAWFDEGLVTYANHSKTDLLGVPVDVLTELGAVCQPVVEAMVAGTLSRGADIAVATSGIAGPDGGLPDKPVGTVWFAWGREGDVHSRLLHFQGGRMEIREQASVFALQALLNYLINYSSKK